MNEILNGWRVVINNFKDILDPCEVIFTFALFKNGKIMQKGKSYNTRNGDAKGEIGEILNQQLLALEQPFLQEKHETIYIIEKK